jgi:DNA helicase-2/ATP-dependent DNA helicase PcrA
LDAVLTSDNKKVAVFRDIISELITADKSNLYEFVKLLVTKAGFQVHYQSADTEEDRNRWRNIEEFVSYVKEFSDKNPNGTVQDLLNTVSLASDTVAEEDGEFVTIATMHAVKGLEFKVVFIVAAEEDIIPGALSKKEEGGIEEERRVMYVAMTRARERLYITNARERYRFNEQKRCIISRFVGEAKGGYVDPFSSGAGFRKKNLLSADLYTQDVEEERQIVGQRKIFAAPKMEAVSAPQTFNRDTSGFVSGAKVEHTRYGEGTILSTEGEGSGTVAVIAFKGLGIKKFSVVSAPIKVVK